MKLRLGLVLIVVVGLLAGMMVTAQDTPVQQVNLADQLVLEGFVVIDSVYSDTFAFVVIHRASDGEVVGVSQPLNAGWTYGLRVPIDSTLAEAEMSAMLHVDDTQIGRYEFGIAENADTPVSVDGQIINTLFKAQVLDATDQPVVDGSVTIRAVTAPVDSWLVVHSGDENTFGGVLGQTLVKAGTSTDVKVTLSGDVTSVLWPMLHVDNGIAGQYEFNGGEIDAPVVLNGQVASLPIYTVNHLRTEDQVVLRGENRQTSEGMETVLPAVYIQSVLSEGPGIVVIHANDNGNTGAILGAYFVGDGLTENFTIPLDPSVGITPVVWPMLHVDNGTVGVYDGLEIDGVASANEQPVTFPISIATAVTVIDQPIDAAGNIYVKRAVIDAPGWLAIHTDDSGVPSVDVVATALLYAGSNWNIVILLDRSLAGQRVWAVIHYDTGVAGLFEFGQVRGTDVPVAVGGNPVAVSITIQ